MGLWRSTHDSLQHVRTMISSYFGSPSGTNKPIQLKDSLMSETLFLPVDNEPDSSTHTCSTTGFIPGDAPPAKASVTDKSCMMRSLRKAASRATGIHGVISRKSTPSEGDALLKTKVDTKPDHAGLEPPASTELQQLKQERELLAREHEELQEERRCIAAERAALEELKQAIERAQSAAKCEACRAKDVQESSSGNKLQPADIARGEIFVDGNPLQSPASVAVVEGVYVGTAGVVEMMLTPPQTIEGICVGSPALPPEVQKVQLPSIPPKAAELTAAARARSRQQSEPSVPLMTLKAECEEKRVQSPEVQKDYLLLVVDIFRQYHPAKAPMAEQLLTKYKGREEELLHRLREKYRMTSAEQLEACSGPSTVTAAAANSPMAALGPRLATVTVG